MEGPFRFTLPEGGTAQFELLSFGLYTPTIKSAEPAPSTASSTFQQVTALALVEQTDQVAARLGMTFGMTCQIDGEGIGQSLPMTWITRFPEGGVINAAGKHFAFDTVLGDVPVGEVIYRCYSFNEPWELVAGIWTFEFLCGERTIFEKSFTVRIA